MLRPAPARLAACLLIAAAAAPAAWAADGPPALAGVLGDFVPDPVDAPAFTALGPAWAAWRERVEASVLDLYDPDATAADQRAAAAALDRAAGELDRASSDPAFADVAGALRRRAALAGAALDALAAADAAPLPAARAGADRRLAGALGGLRSFLAGVPDGPAWLPFARAGKLDRVAGGDADGAFATLSAVVDALEYPGAFDDEQADFLRRPAWRRLLAAAELRLALTPDPAGSVGDRPAVLDAARVAVRRFAAAFEELETSSTDASARTLKSAADDLAAVAPAAGSAASGLLENLYDGDNVRVAIGEGLLKRFIAQTRREKGRVRDVFEGTAVSGTQETDVAVDVDVRPETGAARFDVTLAGVARTSTLGLNRQAQVNTEGVHRFRAEKSMFYDGTRFRGGSTRVEVDPYLRNTRIRTVYDDIAGGAFRGLIQERAFAEAARRQPAALARARRSLTEVLRPQLDRQLTEQFDAVNLRVGGVLRRRAARLGLDPSRETVESTETEMRVFGRLSDPDELAGTPAPPRPFAYDGAVAQIHQSAINNAADRLNLAGRTLTPDELADELRAFAGQLFGRKIPAGPPAPADPTADPLPTLVFADADPVRVRIAAGRAVLTLRIGLLPGGGQEPVPPQVVRVPFAVSLTDENEIAFERGEIAVTALDGAAAGFRGGAVARVLQTRLAEAIPEGGSAPAVTTIATDSRTRIKLAVSSLRLADGWATAVMR